MLPRLINGPAKRKVDSSLKMMIKPISFWLEQNISISSSVFSITFFIKCRKEQLKFFKRQSSDDFMSLDEV